MTGRWWSQPFAPEGSAAAEGIVKQLGALSLDPLTVLVREAAQNTWDARHGADAPLFSLELRPLGAHADAWRALLLPSPPRQAGIDLDTVLDADTPILVVSDRGTVGLGGPLRAGFRPEPGQRPDFVQFVRNIGEPSDHLLGGGTYGFGKGIFYNISAVSTVLVDSCTVEDGPGRRRLIGSSLGPSWYDEHDRRFTGRHWWGDVVGDVPDPLLDDTAEVCAAALGLPGFEDDETGTDIVVIAPRLGLAGGADRVRTRHEAAEFMVSSILWHLWPKMVPDVPSRTMRFEVLVDGWSLPVPDPASTELAPFVRALTRIRDGGASRYRRTVPPRDAGGFALDPDAAEVGEPGSSVLAARPFDGPSRHVARMRSAELVVDYVESMTHPNPRLRYGAVFKASDDADPYFAAAEPPTHDTWAEQGLSGTALGVVRNARHFVHRQVEAELAPRATSGSPATVGLGRLSARLATLLPSPPSKATDGGERGRNRPEQTGVTSRARSSGSTRITDGPRLHVDGDEVFVIARVTVRASDEERRVIAEAYVTVDGAPERQPPAQAPTPSIIGWSPAHGDTGPPRAPVSAGPRLRLDAGEESDWWVVASALPDAVVSLRVGADEGRHRAP